MRCLFFCTAVGRAVFIYWSEKSTLASCNRRHRFAATVCHFYCHVTENRARKLNENMCIEGDQTVFSDCRHRESSRAKYRYLQVKSLRPMAMGEPHSSNANAVAHFVNYCIIIAQRGSFLSRPMLCMRSGELWAVRLCELFRHNIEDMLCGTLGAPKPSIIRLIELNGKK